MSKQHTDSPGTGRPTPATAAHLLFSNGQQTLGVAMPWAIAATLARPGNQIVSVSGDGGFLFAAIERGRVRMPTLQKALTEDGVSIVDVTVDYSRSVDLAATLVEDRSYEHRPGSPGSSVRRSGQ